LPDKFALNIVKMILGDRLVAIVDLYESGFTVTQKQFRCKYSLYKDLCKNEDIVRQPPCDVLRASYKDFTDMNGIQQFLDIELMDNDIIIWRCNSESPESSKFLAGLKERYKQKDITNIRKILEL